MTASEVESNSPLARYEGAVAFIDILGFKGIWRRHNALSVVRKLEWIHEREGGFGDALRKMGSAYLEADAASDGNADYLARLALISDTIVILFGVATPENESLSNEKRKRILLTVCSACRSIRSLLLANTFPPKMTVRGGIGVGEFYASTSAPIFVGEAVDSAAMTEREPEGPFIMLSPDAAILYRSTTDLLGEVTEVETRLKGSSPNACGGNRASRPERRLVILPHDNIRDRRARADYRDEFPDEVHHIRDALDDFYEKFDAANE